MLDEGEDGGGTEANTFGVKGTLDDGPGLGEFTQCLLSNGGQLAIVLLSEDIETGLGFLGFKFKLLVQVEAEEVEDGQVEVALVAFLQ